MGNVEKNKNKKMAETPKPAEQPKPDGNKIPEANKAPETPKPAEQPKPVENKIPEADKTLENPLDAKKAPEKSDPGIIGSIVSTETSEGQESILGEAPEIDTSLLKEAEPEKSITLTLLKILFSFLFFAGLISFLFFTSQLTPRFETFTTNLGIPSVSQELDSVNAEVIRLQTDINLYRYLQIKSFLDKFSFYADSFIHNYNIANSPTASRTERETATERLADIRETMAGAFVSARELMAEPIYAPIVDLQYPEISDLTSLFQERLRAKINERASALRDEADYEKRRDYRNYINTLRLVGNNDLRSLLSQTDFDDLTDAQLYDLIWRVNPLIVNDMSVIQEINKQRIKWSDIINEIEMRTKEVDERYSQDFFDAVGGIRYTSFDFDTSARRISITGEVKTFSTTTFTMIADVVDKLNSSGFFKNGEVRSFSKSGSLDAGYTGSLRLSLDLEENLTNSD